MKQKIEFPCMSIIMVDRDLLIANNWNPNTVNSEKMKLLEQSIIDNGFCFPIVTIYDPDLEKYVIIDGFHRYVISGEKYLDIKEVPIVVLKHDINKRMVATIQFNKARGTHQIELDADLIRALLQQGMSEDEVSIHLGIDVDTIHRYKQLTGIAELFKNANYSTSWDMVEQK